MTINESDLSTGAEMTWCPGCYNFMLLSAVKKAIKTISEYKDIKRKDFSMAAGIGCHGKMFDYLNVGGVYNLHGRVIPTMVGTKIGNPNLEVLGFGGDGDTYSEGISHFIHASRLNPDITMVVHNNKVFALTTGQATPTSEKGFKSKAQPEGHTEPSLNPLELAVANNTSFVARTNPKEFDRTINILEKAMKWEGFSYIDVIMPCRKYSGNMELMDEKSYWLDDEERTKDEALKKAAEWNKKDKLPFGIFYRDKKETMSERKKNLSILKEKGDGWFQT